MSAIKKIQLSVWSFVFLCLWFPSAARADYNYSDTLLVVNDNSLASVAIGEYFVGHRSIPSANVIHIATTAGESVERTEYLNSIKHPIENAITLRGLTGTINYVILTKGIPLLLTYDNNSVDSELAWCLSKGDDDTGCNGTFLSRPNPYYASNTPFSRATYGIYLVTRLDGYAPSGNISQITALIDRSAPGAIPSTATLKSPGRGLFVLDDGGLLTGTFVDPVMKETNKTLLEDGFNTLYNNSNTYITGQNKVFGYWSWGSNANADPSKPAYAIPGNTYENGAIAETAVSTSARSFAWPAVYTDTYQSLIADLIAEGVSAVKGYVYEPGLEAIAHSDFLFDHYLSGYNVAESYYAASKFVNWRDVIVADPKMTVSVVGGGALVLSPASQMLSFNLTNPSYTGSVDQSSQTVLLHVPYGTNVTSLTPAITISPLAIVTPASGVPANFTNPVIYRVIAQNGATDKTYTVTVVVDPNPNLAPLTVSCEVRPTTSVVGSPVTFVASATGGEGNYTYKWTLACFGIGSVCSRTFIAAGSYQVLLIATSGTQTKQAFCTAAVSTPSVSTPATPQNLTTVPTPVTNVTTCNSNAQCGTNKFVDNAYCAGDSVYQDFRNYVCYNPGTSYSSCGYYTTSEQPTTCQSNQTCSAGSCVTSTTQKVKAPLAETTPPTPTNVVQPPVKPTTTLSRQQQIESIKRQIILLLQQLIIQLQIELQAANATGAR